MYYGLAPVGSSKTLFDLLMLQRRFYFINFFIDMSVDVPKCFKGSSSLGRMIRLYPLRYLTNLLSKNGHMLLVVRYLCSTALLQTRNGNINLFPLLNSLLEQLQPTFSYQIYKTSKTVWKFSRRKASRYFIMWKYIPPYKRHFIILRWIRDWIRKESGRTLDSRLRSFWLNMGGGLIYRTLDQRLADMNYYLFKEYRTSLIRTFNTKR